MINTNKRRLESFVVAKVGQTVLGTGATYYTSATGVVALNDGQLTIINDGVWGTLATNTMTNAPTIATTPIIKIMSGTSASANPGAQATFPLWNRPFRATSSIDGRNTISVTKQSYREPAHSVWVIGNTIGQTNAVNVLSNTEYQISIGLRGRRTVTSHSLEESAYLRPSFTSRDYSATGLNLSNALAVDDILTNLSWKINRNSQAFSVNSRFPNKAPIISFLIDTTGTTGTAIGGATPIAAGTVITVVTQTSGTKTITLTEAMAASIKAAAIAYEGVVIASVTSKIMTTDLASAGSATGGTANMIMIMGLDEVTVFEDYVEPVKVRLEVALPLGFNYITVRNLHACKPDEGQGSFRSLDLYWKRTQGQREYNLRHIDAPVINFPTPFVANEKYVTYSFSHGNTAQVDTSNIINSPFLDIVTIPAYSTGTTDNPYIATFDTAINGWLGSTTHNALIEEM